MNRNEKIEYTQSELSKLSHDRDLYKGWKEFIKNQGPYAYYLTITFPEKTNETQRVKIFNQFIIRLSKKIYGTHAFRKGKFLEGFTFLEKTKSGNLHMHTIIKDTPQIFKSRKPTFGTHATEIHKKVFTYFKGSDKAFNIQPIHPNDDINTTFPTNKECLLNYCLKTTKYKNSLEVGNRKIEIVQPLRRLGIGSL
jgi:hypothetical protein